MYTRLTSKDTSILGVREQHLQLPARPTAIEQARRRHPSRWAWTALFFAVKVHEWNSLIGATVRSTVAHASLLVHRVELAIRVGRGRLRVPHGQGIPSRHGVLQIKNSRSKRYRIEDHGGNGSRYHQNKKRWSNLRRCRRGPRA